MAHARTRSLFSSQIAEWAIVSFVCVGLSILLSLQAWLWRPDLAIYDAVLSLQKRQVDDSIAIVAIDDLSLARLGKWPWSRSIHARMLERLNHAGAKAVAFDVIFNEPDRSSPLEDQTLATAIDNYGKVVLPVIFETRGPSIIGESLPIDPLEHAAADLGHISFEYDPDGIGRSLYLWEGLNKPTYSSLALSVLGITDPQRAAQYHAENTVIRPGGWHRTNRFLIPFRGKPGSFTYYSYSEILDGTISEDKIKNKIIFVGATAMGMGDIVPSPVSGLDRPMPGVEVHANVFSALSAGDAVAYLSTWQQVLLTALPPLILMIIFLRSGARASVLWTALAVIFCLTVSYVLYTTLYHWFAPSGAILGCIIAYPLWNWRRQEGIQRYLDEEFALLQNTSTLRQNTPPQAPTRTLKNFDRFQYRIDLIKDAAQHQRDLQKFVNDTLENLPAGVAVVTPLGTLRFYNNKAAALLHTDDREQLTQSLAALPWPASGLIFKNGLPIALEKGNHLSIELTLGEGRALLAALAPLAQIEGQIIGLMIGLTDISDLREAQRRQEETRHFLSHDLRSPLASIIGLVQSMQPDPGTPLPKTLELIEDCAHTALSLADALARLARAESIDSHDFTECDLENIASDAHDQIWGLAQKRNITLILPNEDHDEPFITMGDRDSLFRATVNLLSNAVKYSPDNGTIYIKLSRSNPETLALSIIDQGPGIAPEHLEKLFRRFSRLPENGPKKIDGIGLGLLMVRTVAERHGGKVKVESTLGQGSTFTLLLPAHA